MPRDARTPQPRIPYALRSGTQYVQGHHAAISEVDTWTFTAAAGDRIAVHIGEIVDNNDFRPWIRLQSPAGADLSSTSGTDAAAIPTAGQGETTQPGTARIQLPS